NPEPRRRIHGRRSAAQLEIEHWTPRSDANGADLVAARHFVTHLHFDRGQVSAHRVVARAMIEDHGLTVVGVGVGEGDAPAVHGRYRGPRPGDHLEARALRAGKLGGTNLRTTGNGEW